MPRPAPLTVLLVATGLLLAACTGTNGPTVAPTTTPETATTPPETASAAASSAIQQSAAPTSLDPCQLVTASEASSLAGTWDPAGTEGLTTSGDARTCRYGGQYSDFLVTVAQATDAATALADWTKLQAQAEDAIKKGAPSGTTVSLNVNEVTVTGADKAAVATASTRVAGMTTSFGVSAIFVLKGATFFAFSDLVISKPAPSSSAMETQAEAALGRLP